VHSLAPADRFFVQGSVTKLFSVSAALDDLGFEHHFTTPIYALGGVNGGRLTGNLVLPPAPVRAGQQLSDQELEAAAGGTSLLVDTCGSTCSCDPDICP
jgi:D-alanyl-D-alanine carboxypeptidase